MGGFFFPTQEDYDSYEGFDYSDPLGINKLKKPEEETPNFLGSLMNWADKYEYEGTHDIDPITGEVSKKSLPGILGGVIGDLFSIPKRGVDYLTSKASGLEETRPAEEILTNALFPKYDSAPIADNLLKPFIESIPGGALVTAHDNLSKLKKNDFKPISDAADVTENALRGATRTGGSLLLDPTLWAGINAPGALGTGIGAYFGVEGAKGAAEKLGESYSQAFDQGKPTEAIEPFIEALGLGYLGKTGLEHSSRELAKTLPEIKLGGGYSTRSPINLESSPAPRQIPNFASTMADGKVPSSEAPSFITDLLEPDSLIKRRDELKDLGVLVNPTGRVPRTESLFHGTGNAWAEAPYSKSFDHYTILDDIRAGKYKVGDIMPTGEIIHAIHPDGTVDFMPGDTPEPQTFNAPEGREFNPFSSRKASSSNLHGGPFYLTDAMPVAEGSYAAAGEGQGPNPEIINADVTTNKTWNLDTPVPRDIRVKGLTLLQQLINNEKADVSWTGSDGLTYGKGGAPERLNYYRKAYDRLKQARTGRDVESIMADIIDRSAGGEPIFDRFDPSGLHYTKDQTGRPTYIAKEYPLRQRPDLSPKDKFLQVLESDLGYDSVKHGSKSTGGEVTIPFSRAQIKTRGAQKIAPLSDRSLEGLIAEYKSLDPSKESNQPLREAIKETLIRRFIDDHVTGIPTPEEYAANKDAYDIIHNYGTPEEITSYKRVEPTLTPEDEALIKTPLYESLKNPEIKISESKTPETTDIKDWISEEEPKEIPLGEWVDKAARALGYQDLPVSTSNIQGESLSESAKFIQSQKRKYGKEWETKQTQSEGDYLRKLLSRELAGEKVEETPPTVIQNRESRYEEVDPEIEALRDSISEKSPYEMVGRTPPEKSSLDKSIERVVSKRPPKTPVPKEVDLEGESTKKTAFQVSLSNGEVYTVKATDDINAREQVQDLIDKHGSKFNITDVKPKYSRLESDLITSANPTEERLATRAGKEVFKEEIGSQKWEKSQRQKAQLAELRDQLKVERQKAQAGDKEAKKRELEIERKIKEWKRVNTADIKARDKAITAEWKDKFKVEKQFRDAEAKRKQKEFQAKIDTKEPSGLSQFLGSVKALASSGDLGHIARQGKQGTLYLLTHKPSEVGTAFKEMAKQTFSEKEFKTFHEKLAQDPKLLRMSKDFRLDMPGLPGHLGEEAFHGGEAIESAPVIGAYVKASDRAYTSYMNSIRYSLVKDGISRLEKSGFTMDKNPEKYRELARGINIITQRGDISGKAAQLFNTASNVFWAPRAKWSRIQQIGELVKPGESGRLARQGLAHTMAFNALLFGLLKAKYGDDVKFNTDPENTDFLKIRIKNTTVDPWFGLGAIIRSANQGVSGEKTSGSTGKTVPVSASDAVGSFLTNSLAPGITMLYELASGKSTLGFEKSRLESLLGVAPLAMRDIRDIAEEHGLDGLLLDILSYEGEQINTFNPKKAKAEQERLKKERGLKPSKPKSSGSGTVNYKELYNF